jgi:hypothetical protein
VAFRKKRNQQVESDAAAVVDEAAEGTAEAERPGPRDATEVDEGGAYLDFGGLRIPALPGSTIRLEQDPNIKRIVAVTVLRDSGSLQVRAFAAPRSGGMWEENRTSILEQVSAQGGVVEERPAADAGQGGRAGAHAVCALHRHRRPPLAGACRLQ